MTKREVVRNLGALLYAIAYVVLHAAVIAAGAALVIIVIDLTIILGSSSGSWGPGGAYAGFLLCVAVIKWTVIIGGSATVFLLGSFGIGQIFLNAARSTDSKVRATIYRVVGKVALIPAGVLRAFLKNAKAHFGTLQLIELVM